MNRPHRPSFLPKRQLIRIIRRGITAAAGVWIVSILLLFVTPLPFVIPYILRKGIRLEIVGEFLQTDKTAIFFKYFRSFRHIC
jgi:hypothetical protein